MKTIFVFLLFAIAQGLLPVSYFEATCHISARQELAFHEPAASHSDPFVIDETTEEEDSLGHNIEPVEFFLTTPKTPLRKDSIFVLSTKTEFSSELLRYISRLITSPPTVRA
jgi:hypothetical protein